MIIGLDGEAVTEVEKKLTLRTNLNDVEPGLSVV